MVEVQLRLCGDEIGDVRAYAAHDFAHDITADTPEIRRTLKVLVNDSEEAVMKERHRSARLTSLASKIHPASDSAVRASA